MKKSRFYAWGKTIITLFFLLVGILIYEAIFPSDMNSQDTINILLGIVIFHLLTDKYEKEYKDK